MSFQEGSKWQENNEIRKASKSNSKKQITDDTYKMTNAGVSVEKVTHFATDSIMYLLIVNTKGVRLSIEINKGQFDNFLKIGASAYHNDYTPELGAQLTPIPNNPK